MKSILVRLGIMRNTLVRLGSNKEHTGESRIMRSILVRRG